MTALPVAFKSNPGKYNFQGTTQLINAYAEKLGDDAKATLGVMPSEGVVQFVDTGAGPCRGLIYLEDLNKLYSVHPSSVYRITYNGTTATSTRIGTIPGTDNVQLSRNQKADPQVVVQTASDVQFIESDSVSSLLDDDAPDDIVTANTVSGYTAYGQDTGRFYTSGLNSAKSVAALDFATFEQKSDKLRRIEESAGEMVALKSQSLEFWRNVNDQDFPFAPIAFKSRGLLAKNAVTACDNSLMFIGDDFNAYRLNNYDPAIIGTPHIARLVQEDASQSDILAFSWARGGHIFANFTGTDWSRCYDPSTSVWHSRETYGEPRWRCRHSVQAWGKTLVGDALSGKIGYFDADTYTEFGSTMVWGVDSPPMHAFPNGGIIDAVHFDLGTGYGTLSGQGSNPKIMLQVSKDGGNTFGQYRELELGVQGKYATRVTARRLGKFGPKGAVFRLRISDPVARSIVGVDAEVRPLKR
jgi:hypothetical protein